MRFQIWISLIAASATAVIAEDLLDDSSSNMSVFQDIPEDLVRTDLNIIDDYDLFDDSSVSGSALSTNSDFFELEASCLSIEGQPLSKVRARGEDICAPKSAPNPTSNVQPLPLKGGLREFGGNFKKLFDLMGPTNELEPDKPPPLVPLVPNSDSNKNNCPLEYSNHLCCTERGAFLRYDLGREIWDSFTGCLFGTSDSSHLLVASI